MKAYLIDVNENNTGVIEIEDKLEEYHKYIGCDLIDIARRKIDGKQFCIVCDDMGMLKANPITTALNVKDPQEDFLVGNLIITNREDEDGYLTGLTDEDIILIEDSIIGLNEENKITHECRERMMLIIG